jgi:UrcA family protein
MSSRWKLSAIAAAALVSASLAAAAADTPVERPARSSGVHFADLNLDRSGGAASLYQRLGAAAEKVCSSRAFAGLYYTYADYRSCVADALQQAVTRVNHPALTAYYQQRHAAAVRLATQ